MPDSSPASKNQITQEHESSNGVVATAIALAEAGARQFGRIMRRNWYAAMLVATCAERAPGRRTDLAENPQGRKLPLSRFAVLADCYRETVARYLDTWELAAADGLVPPAASLVPGMAVDISHLDARAWAHYYALAASRHDAGQSSGFDFGLIPLDHPAAEGSSVEKLNDQLAAYIEEVGWDAATRQYLDEHRAQVVLGLRSKQPSRGGGSMPGHRILARYAQEMRQLPPPLPTGWWSAEYADSWAMALAKAVRRVRPSELSERCRRSLAAELRRQADRIEGQP
jgi:hypothetical protein